MSVDEVEVMWSHGLKSLAMYTVMTPCRFDRAHCTGAFLLRVCSMHMRDLRNPVMIVRISDAA